MATPAQLKAAILHGNTIELNLLASPYNQVTIDDVENYASLGFVAGVDTAKSLLRIVSPIGTPVYENAGYLTDDYTSPDFDFDSVAQIVKDLPHVTGGLSAIAGTYAVYVKQKVVLGGDTVYVEKQLSFVICVELLKTGVLAATYNCDGSPATFTVTDNTSLAGADGFVFESVSRTIEIAPPFGSGLSPTTGSSTSFTQSPLWTGTYGFSVEGFITFVKGYDTIIVRYAINGEQLVVCNDILCRMYCCLSGIRTNYYDEANASQKAILYTRLMLGLFEYSMAVRARLCGYTEDISGHVSKFYEVTKCNPNCDTCLQEDAVAPVINDCGCESGTDGKEIQLQMNGSWVQWRYVGDLAWNNLYDSSASIGPAGQNGINGVALVFSDPDTHLTTTTAWETLSSCSTDKTTDGKTLKVKGEILRIYARLEAVNNPSATGISGRLIINGSGLVNAVIGGISIGFVNVSNGIIEMFADLILKDTTPNAMQIRNLLRGGVGNDVAIAYNYTGSGTFIESAKLQDIGGAGVDFSANNYTIAVQGFSKASGDLRLVAFNVTKLSIGSPAAVIGIQYMVPFITTNAVQDYPNVLGGTGKTMLRVYLDGVLLKNSDWTYDNVTDTLTFIINITGASEVAADYQ